MLLACWALAVPGMQHRAAAPLQHCCRVLIAQMSEFGGVAPGVAPSKLDGGAKAGNSATNGAQGSSLVSFRSGAPSVSHCTLPSLQL